MLINQRGVHCLLIFAVPTFSQQLQYQSNRGINRPIGLDGDEFSNNPLFSLHKDLVNTESISGNEQTIAEFLEAYLIAYNYTVERQYLDPLPRAFQRSQAGELRRQKPRFNLLAYPGETRQTPLLLSSHIDTVPPHYGYDIRNHDQIWGRGSVDDKACVAAQFFALQELLAAQEVSPNDVSLLFVVGEEIGGDGMRRVNDLEMEWQTVIFGEPTELKLATGHKGILIFTLKAHGKAGHSGYPWLGQNANDLLLSALFALQRLELPSSEEYGNTTMNIGLISGGVAANVIAEEAQAMIGTRIAAGSPETLKRLFTDTVKAVNGDFELDFSDGNYGPVYIDSDIQGFQTISVNYGTDIPHLKGRHKRYLYGPGSILVAHSDHEHLRASHLSAAVHGYKRIVRSVLKS